MAILLFAVSASAAELPRYWAVHIDSPSDQAAFDRLDADFEKPSVLSDEQRKELNATTAPISEATHKTLRTHHNEIWELDRDLSNVADTRAPKYMVLRMEYVAPPKLQDYEAAVKKLIAGLEEQEIRPIVFFSAYGDGGYRYLFMSSHPFKVPMPREAFATRDTEATPWNVTADLEHWLQY